MKKNVPKVVMMDGTTSFWMIRALIAPTSAPVATPSRMASGQVMPPAVMKKAAETPPRVKTDPTEKSNPPPMVIKVSGQATMKVTIAARMISTRSSGLRVHPGLLHPIDVPVDPIHPDAIHVEPASPVDPRSPPARLGDLDRLTGDLAGQLTERGDVQGRPVVEAEVVVRAGQVVTSSRRTR